MPAKQPVTIPATQHAVQLVGPGELKLNTSKPVETLGPYGILGKVEAVSLCFSDLKLLKQFTDHPRKSELVSGLPSDILPTLAGYVPGSKPTVPGHECVLRIVAIGEKVRHHKVGERCLVQADYRRLRTAGSNGAFGYNFEGALQEYVALDERVVVDGATGERFLIPVPDNLSASAIALVEPWACVENSYVTPERQAVKPGGRMAVVVESGHAAQGLAECFAGGKPGTLVWVGADAPPAPSVAGIGVTRADSPAALANEGYDDIVYFGAVKQAIEILNDKLAAGGILNIVTAGQTIGQPVSVGVGRIHYGMTRWIGTLSAMAHEAYRTIPATGELRDGDSLCIVGAGGPMGQMHVIRDVCTGHANIRVVGTDMDDARLASVMEKAGPPAKANGVELRMVNTKNAPAGGPFSYSVIMAPVGSLVADAIRNSLPGCRINIFAGIPAPVRQELDLDRYIANGCFMFGTSGSTIRDMMLVLEKVVSGRLDTNRSVDAVSGMAGAVDGLAAVENRTLAGKIVVYPMLHGMALTPLNRLGNTLPVVAGKLDHGHWTLAAESSLVGKAG